MLLKETLGVMSVKTKASVRKITVELGFERNHLACISKLCNQFLTECAKYAEQTVLSVESCLRLLGRI